MPVLTREIPTIKIVLPSSKPKDEAWVEVEKDVLMDHLYEVDLSAPQIVVSCQILAKLIKKWNFTDKEMNPLPISEATVRLLPATDIAHISKISGLDQKFIEMTKKKKGS